MGQAAYELEIAQTVSGQLESWVGMPNET
jgi:hypothetical protein